MLQVGKALNPMVTIRLSKSFTFDGSDHFDAHIYAVLDELHALEESLETVCDSDLVASAAANAVSFSLSASAETIDEARTIADSAIRSAIHAAGGATPNWRPAQSPSQGVGAFTLQEERLEVA